MKLFESLLFLTIAYASISNSKDSDPDTNSVSVCDPFKKITKKFTPKSDGSLHLKSVITDESLGNFTFVNGLECTTDSYTTEAEIIAQFESVLATGTLSCEAPVWDGPKVVLECLIDNGNANELDDLAVTVVWAQDINDNSSGGSDDCDYKVESLSVAQTQCLLPACDFPALVQSIMNNEKLNSTLSTFIPSVNGTLNQIDCDGNDNNSTIADLALSFDSLMFENFNITQVSPTEISVTAEIVNNDPFVISETIALTFVDVTTSYALCMHQVSSYVITVVPCCPKEKVSDLSALFAATSDIQPLHPSVTGNFTLVNGSNLENTIASGADVATLLNGISGVLACDDPVEVGNPVTEVMQSCTIDGDLYSVDLVWIDVGDCMFEISSVTVVETQALLPPCDNFAASVNALFPSLQGNQDPSSIADFIASGFTGTKSEGQCIGNAVETSITDVAADFNSFTLSNVQVSGTGPITVTADIDEFTSLTMTFEDMTVSYGLCNYKLTSYVITVIACCPDVVIGPLTTGLVSALPVALSASGSSTLVTGKECGTSSLTNITLSTLLGSINETLSCGPLVNLKQTCTTASYSIELEWIQLEGCMFEVSFASVYQTICDDACDLNASIDEFISNGGDPRTLVSATTPGIVTTFDCGFDIIAGPEAIKGSDLPQYEGNETLLQYGFANNQFDDCSITIIFFEVTVIDCPEP